jgi:hypothetical protein
VETVQVCFDADEAGRQAAEKTIARLAAEGFKTHRIDLQGGQDTETVLFLNHVVQKQPLFASQTVYVCSPLQLSDARLIDPLTTGMIVPKNQIHPEGTMPTHLNNGGQNASIQPSTPTDNELLLKQALAERVRFLKCHPRMNTYQEEIDRMLDKSGNIRDRMAVLEFMIQEKLLEIQKELYKAVLIFREAVNS